MNRRHSMLYEANARILLRELADEVGHAATFADVPEAWMERLASQGFEWLWLLGVWQTGEAGRRLAQSLEWLWAECKERVPGFTTDNVFSSPFAVKQYMVHRDFGGAEALATLRRRLARHGVRLMLDFVPNHMALDHAWAAEAPERFVAGSEDLLKHQPSNYVRLPSGILAHGRDPNFPGWADTLQLNYSRRATREAMIAELEGVAAQCDGVRCDMAMLVLKEVFGRTWPQEPWEGEDEFWPSAIEAVRRRNPDFVFAAEAYWGLESRLIEQGFDYAYDKEFYDELVAGNAGAIRHRLA
ncbi:MAG TPA: alpha-amylase family glycosyl hydrolase, partial [Candidatus Brocadiia bacterium]|nr:alpha-amylase family glycosyl hydrolase [Candidatus Brocadiia bacterium]